ncbi:MAG: hypothetical protein HFH13_06635 [Dorea sp.]|nr:hypothetical protein [Dorea sp.]
MYKKILASMLAVCMLFGNVMLVSAEEPNDGAVSEENREDYAPEPDIKMPEDPAENSWRYSDGEKIDLEESALPEDEEIQIRAAGRSVLRGIDVSEHNKEIDWEKVKASGIDFAIIRCGYSLNTENRDDKQWERNVSECERLGIPYGVYLYSYARNDEEEGVTITSEEWALSEAEHALRLLKGHKPDYPVFYDLEDELVDKENLDKLASVFCNKLEEAGYQAGVYANLYWWTHYLTDEEVYSQWDRWVAQYNEVCDYKGNYGIWQYTSKGTVDGIEGNVDLNYFVVESDTPIGDNIRSPFFDIYPGGWFYPYVEYVANAGIMTGMTLNRFGYEDILSRAQFVTILYRMEGEPEVHYSEVFPDVADGQFYTNAVMWAKLSGSGVVEGYENGTFGPADDITREDLVLMMYRYAKSIGKDVSAQADLSVYPDADKVSDFAKEAMEWAVAIEMVKGDSGLLNPQGKSNRAVCATIITRFMEKFGETEGDKTEEGDDGGVDDGSNQDDGNSQGDESSESDGSSQSDESGDAGENSKGDVSGGNEGENSEGNI